VTARPLVAVLVALVAGAAGLLDPGVASAHPLGNFTINRLDVISVSEDQVQVRWILDQAEIPTFQERGRSPADILTSKRAEALRGLDLRVDGRPVALKPTGPGSISFARGQGGLRTTRVEVLLSASVRDAREVTLRDSTFAGRLGWRGMIPTAGDGTDTTSDLPATEPTRRLRRYPEELLQSPADQRQITLRVKPGDGTVTAPRADGAGQVTTQSGGRSADSDFAGLFDDAAAGQGVLLLLLAAAFGWGALHALSPGHGKTMVAAYLVGAQGTARHAVMLGAMVTVTHTIGVFALGVITLALSQYLLPEDLYPWLNLTAGLLVLIVGGLVFRARLRGVPEGHHHGPGGHTHGPGGHTHGPGGHTHAGAEHAHDHEMTARTEDPPHSHAHDPAPESLRPRVLLAAGASAGLIPCPSALVVLLAAIAQQEIALGLLLIVTFSLGLAATLTALGLAVVYARGITAKWRPQGATARLAALAPALSALIIVVVGVVLTARALPSVV